MAESTTTNSTWLYIHRAGVASSSSTPSIMVDFDVVCTRQSGSQEVTWQIQNMDWTYWGASNYGYYLKIYVAVNPADPYNPNYDTELSTILEKATLTASNWWNHVYLYNPNWAYQKFNSTSTSGTCYIYAEVNDCCRNNGHACYYTNSGSHFCMLDSFTVSLPTYETFYTVSYNANGGSPTPANQTKSSLRALTLTTSVPTLPIRVNYYNIDGSAYSKGYNRAFNKWKCSADNQTYDPGSSYGLNQACTMTAQWGVASFTVDNLVDVYVKLTYVYNGGSGGAAYTSKARAKDGWYTSSSGGTKYTPGAPATSNSNLNLYARYGDATFNLSEMPTPTRSGYLFGGWYKESSLTNKITSSYAISSNANVYAKWIALPVHLKQSNNWADIGPYVWKYSTSDNQWHQVAHIFKANNNTWTDISQ